VKRALFIFRRDLRLEDNLGLLSALQEADVVIPAFIFTPEQIEHNPYRSDRCLQFMIESLEELEKIYLFYGQPEKIVEECIVKLGVDGVFVNFDYTPYSIKRDEKIEAVCRKRKIPFVAAHDLLLHPIEETLKADGTPYTVFTPFYRKASQLRVPKPEHTGEPRFYTRPIPFSVDRSIFDKILPKREKQAPGGRKAAIKILRNLGAGGTRLSPHLKFTTCSVREVYHAMLQRFGPHCELIRALHWREFFTLIGYHFPHVFKGAFRAKFANIHWKNDQKLFLLWCEGKTGFPLIDAGMRQLNQTGFIDNRIRMVVASFLVKDLLINWQWGEKYFARHLIDYDPAVNNGNWQWAASTGCDAQPYFRIFNPWSQGKKFDAECTYIKKWVPELASLAPKVIHTWYQEKNWRLCPAYPPPVMDHSGALERYKALLFS
jgi:deoxyribodipyrimidine photo-lyase